MPTYKEYVDFCQRICGTNVPHYTAEEACDNIGDLDKQFLIIKHDVEDKPEKALALSKIEHRFGIKATYYVHSFFLKNPKSLAILKEIVKLGHEVGYHYDVLDNNNGNKEKATEEFRQALKDFADQGLSIKTICPHGNPLKKRIGYSSNKDFFLDGNVRNLFKEIIDVYLTFPDMIEEDYLYISDAGYAYSYRDAKTTKTDASEKLLPLSEDDIFKMTKNGKSMIISTHSHRYFKYAFIASARIFMFKAAKIVSKLLYKTKWGKYLINKFYFIAKKI